MDVPDGARGLHAHCQHCVRLARCGRSTDPGEQRCDLINCPTGCGHRLHACKLAEHQLLCPEQRVPCINAEYGCGLVLVRRQRAAHLASCPASVVLCMAEWNRWPLLSPHQPAAPPPPPERAAQHRRPIDTELLARDERLLRGCLAPARSLARRLRVFPAVPLRLPGTFDCSHLAPQLQLDREAAAAERRPLDPPGLQRSVCNQLARTSLTSTGNDTNSSRTSPSPEEPVGDSYADKMCMHHIGRDMCKLCRNDPLPARQVVRRTWQAEPAPVESDADGGGGDSEGGGDSGGGGGGGDGSNSGGSGGGGGELRWRRVEVSEPVRERPGKYDLDAALRRHRQLAAEQAAERRRAERHEDCDGPRLALTIDAVAVPERSRPRALYTFQCARPLRRDEFAEHYRRVHGDVHAGAGGWLQQRCPMAQYGCGHVADRLYPNNADHRFTVSPVTGCVGVTDVSKCPVLDSADSADSPPESVTQAEPGREANSQQEPGPQPGVNNKLNTELGKEPDTDLDAESDPGSGVSREWQLEQLPFEVLQHIASLLDPYSLNHLSLTSRLLRDVCSSLLNTRGLVLLLWQQMEHDDGVTWRAVAQSWRFSCAFGPLRRLWLGGGAHMTDHLPRCPYYHPARAAAPFSLLPARGGAEQELQTRAERARESRHRRRLSA